MTMAGDQTEFKNAVKKWLRSHGLDYRWMAERCGVSEITVRNWMSRKTIPPLKQQLIERVMVQLPGITPTEPQGQAVPGVEVNASLSLTVQLVPELYRRLTDRALSEGCTPEALVAQAIAELVKNPSPPTADMRKRTVTLPQQS